MRKKTVVHRSELISPSHRGMHRREFLMLGSTAVVGLAATSLPAQVLRSISNPRDAALSIGYLDYLPRVSQSFPARTRLVPAESLSSGDRSFTNSGALIRLVGFWRPLRSRSTPLSATLLTYYPATAAHDKAPFVVWTYYSDGSRVFDTPRAMVHTPVDEDGIALALITSKPATMVESTHHTTFSRVVSGHVGEVLPSRDDLISDGAGITLSSGRGGLKLRAGTYFVALGQTGTRVDWSAVRSADLGAASSLDPRGAGPLSLASLIGSSPVDFSYLALSIEASTRQSVRV
jgi:hypothetical protein